MGLRASHLHLRAKNIWSHNVPNKIKHFLWRICSDSLSTQLNLFKRKIASSSICTLCQSASETIVHALRDCGNVKGIWEASGLLMENRLWEDVEGWEWLQVI